jgi:hypothetical protein
MTHPETSSIPDPADHWLAYRYLTGELSDDEAAACEARLQSDLSLQVALAECVELTSGLSHLSRPPAVVSASRRVAGLPDSSGVSGRAGVWAAAAVVLLAAGLLLTSASLTPQQVARHEGGNAQVLDPSSVLAMWSELGDDSHSSADRGERAEKFDPFSEEELDIPDWMLLAVLEESDEGEDAEPLQEHQL